MNLHFKPLTLLILVLAIFTLDSPADSSFAQSRTQKIDRFLQDCYQNGQFNGAVLVAEHGKVIYNKAYGVI